MRYVYIGVCAPISSSHSELIHNHLNQDRISFFRAYVKILISVRTQVKEEGTHFLIPWLQRAIIYDVRTCPRNISTTTGSKDLQMVSLTLRVLHRPEVPALPKIYQVRLCFDISISQIFQQSLLITLHRTLVSTMMSVSCHPLATKYLRLSLHNLTPLS